MTQTHDVAVVIGRWQLPHLAHKALINHAFDVAGKVLIVIGSAYRARDPQNPFSAEERQEMLRLMLTPEQLECIKFLPLRDYFEDGVWAGHLRARVHQMYGSRWNVALVGYKKDAPTANYLGLFPNWDYVDAGSPGELDATSLRNQYFGGLRRVQGEGAPAGVKAVRSHIDPAVANYLENWALDAPRYQRLVNELQAILAYRQKYTAPVYLTADAVVEIQGHVLLIERGGNIGNGLWALPGGFVEPGETFYAAALRELQEETGMAGVDRLGKRDLRGSQVFDHPGRSMRGRIITQAFHFKPQVKEDLPAVVGQDDAKKAAWVRIADLHQIEDRFFEDHAHILDHFVGLTG